MPMQPRPIADTSRLLLPSLRLCMNSPSTKGARLRYCSCALFFAPASRWNSFPRAESADEGVGVLISEKIGRFTQLENGIIEVVARKSTPRLLQKALEARACVPQTALQSARADMKRVRYVIDRRTPTRELLLNGAADALGKIFIGGLLFQLRLVLGSKHRQQLGIAGHQRPLSVRGAKDDGVVRGAANYGTTEVALNRFLMRARLSEFYP